MRKTTMGALMGVGARPLGGSKLTHTAIQGGAGAGAGGTRYGLQCARAAGARQQRPAAAGRRQRVRRDNPARRSVCVPLLRRGGAGRGTHRMLRVLFGAGLLNAAPMVGNPGDYVFSERGLDDVVTRLMDQEQPYAKRAHPVGCGALA
jgi:hypothetical protein